MNTVIINGLFVGLVYALLAVGLVVTYRSSRVINFAYGETGMLVAFVFAEVRVGQSALTRGGGVEHRSVFLALAIAVAIGALLGAGTEYFVLRPLRNAPRIQPLVGTFAVASLFFAVAARRWGVNPLFVEPLVHGRGIRTAGITISPGQLLILVVAIVALVGVGALYRYTSFGLQLRAIAVDPYAAGLVGVNVDRTSMLSWALAGSLAGLSAILIAPLVGFSVIFMTGLTIRGLAAALVGGLTNIWGAVLAGLGIGVVEAFIAFKSPITGITDVAVALFILVLMLARPQGLVRSAY